MFFTAFAVSGKANLNNSIYLLFGFVYPLFNPTVFFVCFIHYLHHHKSAVLCLPPQKAKVFFVFLFFLARCTPEIESQPVQTCSQVQWSLPVIFVIYDQSVWMLKSDLLLR